MPEIKKEDLMKKIKAVRQDDDAKVEHFILDEDDVNKYFSKRKKKHHQRYKRNLKKK